MKPFFLRRLKADVLKALPEKTIELLKVPMTTEQHMTYFRLVQEYKKTIELLKVPMTTE